MKKIFICLLVYTFLVGCGNVKYIPVGTTDSVKVEIVEKIIIDTIQVAIPSEFESSTKMSTDTSFLKTSIAESEAYVDGDGTLHHTLRNRSEEKLQAIIRYIAPATTIEKYRFEPIIKEVEKELTWIENKKLQLGGWAMLAIAALLVYYLILILIKRLKIL